MIREETEVIEAVTSRVFRIRPKNHNDYSFRERNGVFRSSRGQEWAFRSEEITSHRELCKLVPEKLQKGFADPGALVSPDHGQFVRSGDRIAEFLGGTGFTDWEIVFREFTQNRVTRKGKSPYRSSEFRHHSVLIRFRKPGRSDYIEVGEGNTDGKPFNTSGLLSRCGEIQKCISEAGDRKIPVDVPVVLNAGEGGIVFHEILGHSLEADHIYGGMSPFRISDMGKKLISGNISLSTFRKDDPFFRGFSCDDEGNDVFRSNLIEHGVLKHIISDDHHSALLNIPDRGSSRMEDFSRKPAPRMFSIYLENGTHSKQDILGSTGEGIFAREFGEGKVVFHKNLFYFNIPSAYLIRGGRIAEPLGSVVVSGDIKKALNSVEMVGDDFSFDRGISYCFKNGQSLNVRVGQPTVKIGNLKVTRGINDH